ncbi:MAG: DUF11 domain-containing protein [Chloroflexi bacterium]|nr:MAG: DUF11 domain-containing protein [Chloroflexota bacterium]
MTVGGTISDVAHLGGTFNGTGTITFHLFGPDDATCADSIFSSSAPVDGNGNYDSGDFTTLAAGTYRWIASYTGDANNDPVSGKCNDANEAVVVSPAKPAISTTATEGSIIGGKVKDVAHLSGGFNPTGSITFNLYGPGDDLCVKSAIFTDEVAVNGNGDYTSAEFTVQAAGVYQWIASYSGDGNNDPVSGSCGDDGEQTTVTKNAPSISTTLHSGDISGGKITVVLVNGSVTVHDSAALSGASADAGGTVTYTVFTDDACQSSFADAGTKTVVNGNVPDSDPITFTATGVFYWQAHYSGDLNNAPATSACADEVLTVTQPHIHAVKSVDKSTANPGDVVTWTITVVNDGDAAALGVEVSDDISAILAHATFNSADNGGTLNGSVITWPAFDLAANGGTKILHFSATLDSSFPEGTTHLPNTVVVVGPGSNCPAQSEDPDCSTDTTVEAHPSIHAVKTVDKETANPGDVVTWTITVTNNGDADASDVEVTDDISAILAHATFNSADNGGTLTGSVISWTIDVAAHHSVVLHFSAKLSDTFPVGITHLPNTVVVVGPGSNCPAQSEDPDCSTDTTVNQPALTIEKTVSGNTGGTDPILGVPSAKVGDNLLYTLTWTLKSGPVHNAVIVDHLPAGMTAPTSISDGGVYDAVTNTITWHLGTIAGPDDSGFVTYNVKVKAADAALAQPLRNVATIKSDETPEDSDDAVVAVQGEVKQSTPTPRVTPPNTSTGDAPSGTPGNPGVNLMLILLTLGAVTLVVGFLTPAPATVRRRNRRG